MPDTGRRRRQKVRNVVQTGVLLGSLVLIATLLAGLLFGRTALLWVLLFGAAVVLLRPRVPTRTLLGMYGAQPLPYAAAPELNRVVAILADRAGLHAAPTVYYVPSAVPNAFAVGQGEDVGLAVTDGLLRRLTSREMVGVVAHELGHVRAGDTRVMTLSDGISRFTQGLSYVAVLSVLFAIPMSIGGDPRLLVLSVVIAVLPFVVTLLQFALSRSREYDADLEGAVLTGDPEGLARALEELDRSTGPIWERLMVPRGRLPDPLLLRTHPPTAERARRLRELVPTGAHHPLGTDRPMAPAAHRPVSAPSRLRFPGIYW